MRRLLVVILAILASWFLGALPANAGQCLPTDQDSVHAWTFSADDSAAPGDTATERAPPGCGCTDTIYAAVGVRSPGTAERPDAHARWITLTYDYPGALVHAARGCGSDRRGVRATNGYSFAFEPSRVAANTSAFSNLTHSSSGIAPYSVQRTVTAGQGGSIQAHHLIERRFADVMGQTVGDMPSIVVTRAEHQVFTNAWREAIPYGPTGTGRATPAQVEAAARQIYREYPEILQALGLG